MCCGCRACVFCICLIMIVVVIGLIFVFGVFKHEFHKIKDNVHVWDPNGPTSLRGRGRPFLGFAAPPP